MKKIFVPLCYVLITCFAIAQTKQLQIQKAFQQFESDPQLKHAMSSLYVIDGATGEVVFDKNSQVGLAPASTQKIFTSVTAFDLLGKDFRYQTELGYYGSMKKDTLDGCLFIKPSGDPTFGSWRYPLSKDSAIYNEWYNGLHSAGIGWITGGVYYDDRNFSKNTIPDGWIWQDIGNYYGAYSDALNWKENQVDLLLRSGSKAGDPVSVPREYKNWKNELKTGEKGSGDNAYAYLGTRAPLLTGTIPPNEPSFKISITDWLARYRFINGFAAFAQSKGINGKQFYFSEEDYRIAQDTARRKYSTIIAHYSPTLDSIIYWFLKKSINLYGEALVKTFAYEKEGFASTDAGVAILKEFWKQKGLDEDELNIRDGSGLSPINRVTTHAQVEVLKYAKTKDWFTYFYDALPEYNNMKMKSGTISDVKAFCGYQKANDGREYVFSFIVNNFSGRTSELVAKMYKVLDNLK